jgi:signal transduction histidine kinase
MPADMVFRILSVNINSVQDAVAVRQRARQISGLLGFGVQDQVRIAAAVSEITRSTCAHASGGKAIFEYDGSGSAGGLIVHIFTNEGGEPDLSTQPQRDSGAEDPDWLRTIDIARHLMIDCAMETGKGCGASITLRKLLPSSEQPTSAQLANIASQLAADTAVNSFWEIQQQNRELLEALAQLKEREEDLLTLTRELEDTNRGVLALYAEIDEKAKRIQHADGMKSRFLSNTSHELRTPLGSIQAVSRILLDKMDGELTPEQEKQVRFIERAANELSGLVNDLLDLAKIEAGKVEVNASSVLVRNLFSGLKGMLRPLATKTSVELVFHEPEEDLAIGTDEGKVTQILRNFITNALKFTDKGHIQVSVALLSATDTVRFTVSDTGLGIAPENLQLIFEEFSQIENSHQRIHKGTGLGLPLCRKLAKLLKGEIGVNSILGIGSTFFLDLPRQYTGNSAVQSRDMIMSAAPPSGDKIENILTLEQIDRWPIRSNRVQKPGV